MKVGMYINNYMRGGTGYNYGIPGFRIRIEGGYGETA
jgi:hypothetical protein